ncbi:substrate-binding periplasmic protein [Spartinivicinus ruber]|uniref:substrate-binding periplasmic protein n=1 Tax=Spartinivicinus ruber TaxID=2683272 RepID=UPI0013D5B514|nr:transporter substrate-binding domain-containing protein [Spartinivicinus ruber]
MKIIWFVVIYALSCLTVQSSEREVKLAYGEYPPYYGKNLVNGGVITEIVKEAFKQVNYEVKIDFIASWARRLEMAKQGGYDGIYSAWYRKDREEFFVFSDPLPANVIGFYKRKEDDISFKSLEELKSYKIGVIVGYSNAPKFKRAKLQTYPVVKEKANIGKLILKRIDLALIDKGVGKYILTNDFPESVDKIEWLSPPIEVVNQHLIISKKAKDFQNKISDFNKGLDIITKKGRLEEILEKHGF